MNLSKRNEATLNEHHKWLLTLAEGRVSDIDGVRKLTNLVTELANKVTELERRIRMAGVPLA